MVVVTVMGFWVHAALSAFCPSVWTRRCRQGERGDTAFSCLGLRPARVRATRLCLSPSGGGDCPPRACGDPLGQRGEQANRSAGHGVADAALSAWPGEGSGDACGR